MLTPYPEVTPAHRDNAGADLDLTWAVSQEREMDPKQVYFYKMKELETFIRHDSIKIKAEKDVVHKAESKASLFETWCMIDLEVLHNANANFPTLEDTQKILTMYGESIFSQLIPDPLAKEGQPLFFFLRQTESNASGGFHI